MKTRVKYPILCAALLAVSQAASYSAEDAAGAAPPSRTEAVLTCVTASVEAIDYTNREVTLKGPLGNEVTFVVDERVKRLNEIHVGDLVDADYYVSVAGELRKPTEDEEAHPIQVLEVAAKAPPGTTPAAGGLRQFKVVATVEGLDRPTKTVTLKGPRGNYLTVRVADPARLTQARIGDHVVLTYTEALAVTLEKAKKKSSE